MVGRRFANCNNHAGRPAEARVARNLRRVLQSHREIVEGEKHGHFAGFAGNAGLSIV
jgi:hypothetical protein